MFRKLCLLASFVLLLATVGNVFGIQNRADTAVINYWVKGDATSNWSKPLNWSLTHAPLQVPPEDAIINDANKTAPTFGATDTNTEPVSFIVVGHEDGTGVLNITGGTFYVSGGMTITDDKVSHEGHQLVATTSGTINMSGGTLRMNSAPNGYLDIGRWGYSYFNMTDGTIDINRLAIPGRNNTTVNGIFNLDGGVVKIRDHLMCKESIDATLKRTPWGGTPWPGRGVLNVRGGTMILGTNYTQYINKYVSDANIVPYPETTGHAWAVVEYNIRNASKTTLTADQTISVKQAYQPDPFNGHPYTAVSPTLRWTPGHDANDHDVYFGTASDALVWKTHLKSCPDPNYSPGPRTLNTTYYWRINEEDASNNITTGVVWSFTVGGKARYPYPGDSTMLRINANRDLKVYWKQGLACGTHDVYYGTDYTAVSTADTGDPEWKGNQLYDTNNYTPSKPAFEKTYYWRIDEVNTPNSTLVKGDVWKLTMEEYLLEEDYESYKDATALLAKWKHKSGTGWNHGLEYPVDNIRHENDYLTYQSMYIKYYRSNGTPISYNDEFSYETFDPDQNWKQSNTGNAKALSFWIRGQPSNDNITDIYVYLKDHDGDSSNKKYITDTADFIRNTDWTEINIKLTDINTGSSFELENVDKLIIGADIPAGSSGFCAGYLYIDDIRLYPSRCVSEENGPAGDVDKDCIVDYNDLGSMKGDWTRSDSNESTDGQLTDGYSWVAAHDGNGVTLNGIDGYIDVEDGALPNFYNKTIAFWVKKETTEPIKPSAEPLLFGTTSDYRVYISITSLGRIRTRLADKDYSTDSEDYDIGYDWHHIVFAITPIGGAGGTEKWVEGRLYINGAYKFNQQSWIPHYGTELDGACIGALNNGLQQFSNITIDDFRIYNRQLTDANIADLYAGSGDDYPTDTPIIHYTFDDAVHDANATNSGSVKWAYRPIALMTSTDTDIYDSDYDAEEAYDLLTNSDKVNFRDYAEFAKSWLDVVPNWP